MSWHWLTVLKNHHNDTDVFQHHDIVPQRWFLGLTSHRHIEALGRGCVPTQEFHGGCANQEKDSRNDHGNSPGSVCWHARTHHWIEQHRDHKNLCNTATQVPPASCCGIGRANHVWGKHQRAPELVGDKGSSCRICPSKVFFCAENKSIQIEFLTMAYGCWKNCCLVVGWLLVVVVAGGRWVWTGGMLTLRILEKNVNK